MLFVASWLSWLERRPVTAEVEGSSPSGVVEFNKQFGILAQLGEHLPYKQRVIGSSPIGPIIFQGISWPYPLRRRSAWLVRFAIKPNADVAQLAEQLICNQQVNGSSPLIGSIWMASRVAKGDRL